MSKITNCHFTPLHFVVVCYTVIITRILLILQSLKNYKLYFSDSFAARVLVVNCVLPNTGSHKVWKYRWYYFTMHCNIVINHYYVFAYTSWIAGHFINTLPHDLEDKGHLYLWNVGVREREASRIRCRAGRKSACHFLRRQEVRWKNWFGVKFLEWPPWETRVYTINS